MGSQCTPAISTYTSILMHPAYTLQNLQCPSTKTIKYYDTLVKQFGYSVFTYILQKNTCKSIDKDFQYLRSVWLGQYERNHPTLTSQLHSKQRLRRWTVVTNLRSFLHDKSKVLCEQSQHAQVSTSFVFGNLEGFEIRILDKAVSFSGQFWSVLMLQKLKGAIQDQKSKVCCFQCFKVWFSPIF